LVEQRGEVMPSRSAESNLRAAVSVTQMAKMVGLSRASFYAHVAQGHFLKPLYPNGGRRPVYTADMQRQNLEVRATQKGVNGEFVIFYERQQPRESVQRPGRRGTATHGSPPGDLRRRLEGLGLADLTDAQVEQALAACFPLGASSVAEGEVLRAVYRHLRRSEGV
jgi:hypothetical protein